MQVVLDCQWRGNVSCIERFPFSIQRQTNFPLGRMGHVHQQLYLEDNSCPRPPRGIWVTRS